MRDSFNKQYRFQHFTLIKLYQIINEEEFYMSLLVNPKNVK